MEFVCPKDGKKLLNNPHYLICSKCGSKYNKEGNLLHFLDSSNAFYEGAYKNTVSFLPGKNRVLNSVSLWTINSGYLNHVKNNFNENDRLLEVGCAGGVSYFGLKFRMLGCDLSLSSLLLAKEIYSDCIHANPLEGLPIPDNSVEGVISSYFWEHLSESEKVKCLEEFHRILKPKGKLVFLYDVETTNPLINYYKKKDLKLYKKFFLEIDRHIGYQTVSSNSELICKNNFKIKKNIGLQKTFFQEPSVYEKLLNWDQSNFVFKFLSGINKSSFLKPYLFILRVIDVFSFFLPISWSRICLTIAEVDK